MHTPLMKPRVNDLITLTITFILNIANLDALGHSCFTNTSCDIVVTGGIHVLKTHLVISCFCFMNIILNLEF